MSQVLISPTMFMAPVFAMIALTFFVVLKMGRTRTASVAAREVRIKDIALGEQNWSDEIKKISNSYASQMQLPLVFYATVGFYLVLDKADLAALILSWAFVATRYIHFFIHTTSNHVPKRFMAFVAGVVSLICLWLWLAFRLYALG